MLTWVLPVLLAAVPELCVKLDADIPPQASVVELRQLLPALQARLTRRAMRVSACGPASTTPDWRVTVKGSAEQVLQVQFESERSQFQLGLNVEGLSERDVVEQLALKIAEAVRPTREAAFDEAPAPEVAAAAAVPPVVVEQPHLDVELAALAVAGVPTVTLAGGGLLAVGLRSGRWRFSVGAGGLVPTTKASSELTLSTSRLDLGLGVDFSASVVELGVRACARRAFVRITSSTPDLNTAPQDYWAFAAGARVSIWPVRWRRLALGAGLEGTTVWRPRTFSVAGQPVLAQSFFEGSLYLGVRFYPLAPAGP